MRDGEEEEEEEESGSKAEFIWLTESNPFPVLNRTEIFFDNFCKNFLCFNTF